MYVTDKVIFNKGQILMVRLNGKACGVLVVKTKQQWSNVQTLNKRGQSSSWVRTVKVISSDPELTEGLPWHVAQKILMTVMGGMCQNMWGNIAEKIYIHIDDDSYPSRKHLQWPCEHQNCTLEVEKKVV